MSVDVASSLWLDNTLTNARSTQKAQLATMNRRIKSLLVYGMLLWPLLLTAADQARIPYELIYRIQKAQTTLRGSFTNLIMDLRMKSTLPEVRTQDLTVYIDSKDGRIPVQLNPANGAFTLPMQDSLVAEGAYIEVNQPKGTMNFQWFVGLKVAQLPTNGIRYRDLMQPLKDLEQVRIEMEKIPGAPPLTIAGLKLLYPPDKETSVVVHAKGGNRVFKINPAHAVVIPYEAALLEQNPVVSIPVPPIGVDVADPGGGS